LRDRPGTAGDTPLLGTRYNQFAGGSVERLAAISDGIFAVGMTLLVLELKVPPHSAIHSEAELCAALAEMAPHLLFYVMSFLTLGIFWVGQQTQLNHLAQSDRNLSWLHLAFLFAVTMMPFSTSMMGEFLHFRSALLLYWLNILVLGALLLACWRYAAGHALLKPDLPADTGGHVERRILIAQALYAVGAALCFFGTLYSIGFILLVQANYALGLVRKI
jgi:uncharacterized membrane protein